MRRLLSLAILVIPGGNVESRSHPLRAKDPYTPTITVSYAHSPEIVCSTTNSLLELYPLFYTYDETHFKKHILPKGPIAYRNKPKHTITGKVLSQLINGLFTEIITDKKKFADFTVLKDQDFNYQKHAGALVLKMNDYPFVVKLFIESPESWICPHHKGFESWCHHVIGGGVSRHLCGFTRIKNRDWAFEQIQTNENFKGLVDFPRKWFWLPDKPTYLQLTGQSIGNFEHITKEIPAVYAIVADAIDIEKPFSMRRYKDRKLALDIANFLNMRIDAHINNFVYEKDTDKIVLIDTELFTVLVGLKKPLLATGFASYYAQLIKKAFMSYFFSTKEDRRKRQEELEPPCGLLD